MDEPARADLHVHSEFSWDAPNGSMEETCRRAEAFGLPAVAFTDHADYRKGGKKAAPSAQEVQEALATLPGVSHFKELPTDDRAHSFEFLGAPGTDVRHEILHLLH